MLNLNLRRLFYAGVILIMPTIRCMYVCCEERLFILFLACTYMAEDIVFFFFYRISFGLSCISKLCILFTCTEKNVLLKITMFYCNQETDSNS